jgi:5'-3' exonuclease
MNTDQLLLIDLSGLAHQIWHTAGNEPDPSFVSTQIIARVRSLASAHPHAAICCDDGKSFRADLDPAYKAHRDTENRAPLRHQMDVACDTLRKDGFPVWRVKGFEADDLIATAVHQAGAIPDTSVLIASSDKDLLQLVNERVTCKSLRDGKEFDAAAVVDKFKVQPAQMLDYLCLVGDTSDNIKGAVGIGGVGAAKLLNDHGSLENVYAGIGNQAIELKPSILNSLTEFRDRWPLVRSLVTLRTDAPIEFSEIAAERTAPAMEVTEDEVEWEMSDDAAQTAAGEAMKAAAERVNAVPFENGNDANDAPLFEKGNTAAPKISFTGEPPILPPSMRMEFSSGGKQSLHPAAVAAERIQAAQKEGRDPSPIDKQALMVAAGPIHIQNPPVDFSQQLEPRTMPEAITLAKHMFESRLFGAYGTPQAVLATVLAGREIGIPAMASLRAFHIIEGKPTMSAGAIQALVLKSRLANYFRCTERTADRATFVTKRGDDPEMTLTYTIEDGRQAWSKDDAAWKKSGWGRNPADMLVARASSKLARLVYPDVVSGLYAPEEME